MKPSLVLRMGQYLMMTPQPQKAIRLLVDPRHTIQENPESNPMLERQEEGADLDNGDLPSDNIEKKSSSNTKEPSYQESA